MMEATSADSIKVLGSAWAHSTHFVLGLLHDGRFWLAWQFGRRLAEKELADLVAHALVRPPDQDSYEDTICMVEIGDAEFIRSAIAGFAYPMCDIIPRSELDEMLELMRLVG